MQEKSEDIFIAGRHSSKPARRESGNLEFPSLTDEGVSEARKKAHEFKAVIDTMPEDGVFMILGASYEDRTKATGEIYGDELAKIYADSPNVRVITKGNLSEQENALDFAKSVIHENANKKLVFSYPLYLKEFDFGHNWSLETEEGAKYFNKILEDHDYNEEAAVSEWMEDVGKDSDTFIPNPNRIAEQYLSGFKRLRGFVRNHITKERPLIITTVAHRWDLDSFITKMAKGNVTADTFREVIGYSDNKQGLTNENETVIIKMKNQKTEVNFRGKNYTIPEE